MQICKYAKIVDSDFRQHANIVVFAKKKKKSQDSKIRQTFQHTWASANLSGIG